MPRKLPISYLRRLNEERKREAQRPPKAPWKETIEDGLPMEKLKGFEMVCQACGTRAKFIVGRLGYATCSNCHAQAANRIGVA